MRIPDALCLIYPALSFDLECWMKPAHLEYMRTESHVDLSQSFLKSKVLKPLSPLAVETAPRAIDVLTDAVDVRDSVFDRFKPKKFMNLDSKVPYIHSYLSMTSRLTYFADRVLPPECIFNSYTVLRAMSIMYLAESPLIPDLHTDYYLSPILAPNALLAQFPKTFLLCGEKDPIVDDTIIFANRLREAKGATGAHSEEVVRTKILPGLSHAFQQIYAILPESRQAAILLSNWFLELLSCEPVAATEMHQIDEITLLKRRRHQLASELLR